MILPNELTHKRLTNYQNHLVLIFLAFLSGLYTVFDIGLQYKILITILSTVFFLIIYLHIGMKLHDVENIS